MEKVAELKAELMLDEDLLAELEEKEEEEEEAPPPPPKPDKKVGTLFRSPHGYIIGTGEPNQPEGD